MVNITSLMSPDARQCRIHFSGFQFRFQDSGFQFRIQNIFLYTNFLYLNIRSRPKFSDSIYPW